MHSESNRNNDMQKNDVIDVANQTFEGKIITKH